MSADGNTLGIGARRNFEIGIPSIDDDPCISFLFLGEHISVPDNIKFGEPEIVPLIAGDLSQRDIEYYVKELGFKPPKRFTPPEKEAVKTRLMEEYPEMSIDCINAALDIDTDGDNLLTSPTATTHPQIVFESSFIVIKIMRWGNFYTPCSKPHVDIVICNNWNLPIRER
jgi:hypothetical protein